MYIRFIILVLLLNICYSCQFFIQNVKDEAALKEIVLLRIEGLILVELLADSDQYHPLDDFQLALLAYYEKTEADFLDLYHTQQLSFSYEEQDSTVKSMECLVDQHNSSNSAECLMLIQRNLNNTILAYTAIIQEQKHDDTAYFCFLALPGLFNLQKQLQIIVKE